MPKIFENSKISVSTIGSSDCSSGNTVIIYINNVTNAEISKLVENLPCNTYVQNLRQDVLNKDEALRKAKQQLRELTGKLEEKNKRLAKLNYILDNESITY